MASSTAFRIDDLQGDVTDAFFGNDWNANSTVQNSLKFKAASGTGLKLTLVRATN